MRSELFGRSLFQLVSASACGIEHRQQCEGLLTHRSIGPRCRSCGNRMLVMIPEASWSIPRGRPAQRSAAVTRVLVSFAAAAGVGAMARIARASGLAKLVAERPAKVSRNDGWYPRNRSQFVAGFRASTDRVLLGARENCDGLGQLAVGRKSTIQMGVDPQR